MKVNSRGQVTIPKALRDRLGVLPGDEVEFVEEERRIRLLTSPAEIAALRRFSSLRGVATIKTTTNEIMTLTRGDE